MKHDEQENIMAMKTRKLIEQDWCCAACGEKLTMTCKMELAHILPQRRWIIAKYGKEIIHHELNMSLTHSGDCNAKIQMSPNKTKLVELHVSKIREAIDNEYN